MNRLLVLWLLPAFGGHQEETALQFSAKASNSGKTFAVQILGRAALPDGAQLVVRLASTVESFKSEERRLTPASGPEAGLTARVEVRQKRWEASFTGVAEGVYEVSARFDPSRQPAAIKTKTKDSSAAQALIVGGGKAILNDLAADERKLHDALDEAARIFKEAGGRVAPAQEKLVKWYREWAPKLQSSRLPATSEYLRSATRGIAIWGQGPMQTRGGGGSKPPEGDEKEADLLVREFLHTARQLLIRERASWDVKLALTWVQEVAGAGKALEKIKDRMAIDWRLLEKSIAGRIDDLEGLEEGLGKELAALAARSRQLADKDPEATEEFAGEIQKSLETWRILDGRLRTVTPLDKRK